MRETATVRSVDGTTIVVSVGQDCGRTCAGCARDAKGGTFAASNTRGFPLQPGDRVEVFVSPGKVVLEGSLLFILPLALFALFYALSRVLFRVDDSAGFFIGCGGIVAGFLVNGVRKLVRKDAGLPDVVAKLG